jgi:hypothetical protein
MVNIARTLNQELAAQENTIPAWQPVRKCCVWAQTDFWVRGKKFPQDDREAEIVYNKSTANKRNTTRLFCGTHKTTYPTIFKDRT